MPGRYDNLVREVANCKPRTIVEVGTWNGVNASKMINAAAQYKTDIIYYGFDIFESIDAKIREKELHTKRIMTESNVKEYLKSATSAKINLCVGYTSVTLPEFNPKHPIDFIYIDGGHSLDTIESDWLNLKKHMHRDTVVLFDDYYTDNTNEGCYTKICELDADSKYAVELLEPVDTVGATAIHPELHIRIAKVTLA